MDPKGDPGSHSTVPCIPKGIIRDYKGLSFIIHYDFLVLVEAQIKVEGMDGSGGRGSCSVV